MSELLVYLLSLLLTLILIELTQLGHKFSCYIKTTKHLLTTTTNPALDDHQKEAILQQESKKMLAELVATTLAVIIALGLPASCIVIAVEVLQWFNWQTFYDAFFTPALWGVTVLIIAPYLIWTNKKF